MIDKEKIKEIIKRMFTPYLTEKGLKELLEDIDDNPDFVTWHLTPRWFFEDEVKCGRRKMYDLLKSYYEILVALFPDEKKDVNEILKEGEDV